MRIRIKTGRTEIEVEDDAHDFNEIDKSKEHPHRLVIRLIEELIGRCEALEANERKMN